MTKVPSAPTPAHRKMIFGQTGLYNLFNSTFPVLLTKAISVKKSQLPRSTLWVKQLSDPVVENHKLLCLSLYISRLHEFDEQVRAVRDGMSRVIPAPLIALFNASELETLVCGSPDIPVQALRASATYKGELIYH